MSNQDTLKPEIFQYYWVVPRLESAAQIWFDELRVGPLSYVLEWTLLRSKHS
jgi:hypothetical protein